MKRILLLLMLALPSAQVYAQGCGNLVVNGNFSAGNSGFTSQYVYNPVSIVAASTYAVVAQFNTVHSGFFGNDHTNPPTGLAMIINGSSVANTIVWEQTITGITPNTTYYFSTWVNKQNGNPPPTLQFSINGSQIGSNFSPTTTPNVWQQFFASWFSGPNTSATIRLIDQQTASGGNDFAIDDIFFTSTSPAQIASATASPATNCNGNDGSIKISATGGVPPYRYSKDNGATYVSGSNPYTFTGLTPGNYTVVVKDTCGNVSNSQVVAVGAIDLTPPVISNCPGNFAVNTGPNNMNCRQVATWTPPTAVDACGGTVTVSSTHKPGDTFDIGGTIVVYTFSDPAGNESYCWFYVTVVDNTPPRIVTPCPNDTTIYTGPGNTTCRARAMWKAPAAVDNCSTVTTTSSWANNAWMPVGTNTVTYTFKDAKNNFSTCSFKVTVVDNTPPVALCKPYTLTLSGGTGTITPANVDNGSDDNCGIASRSVSPSTFTCAQAGTVQPVVLTVTDIHGNSSTCTAMVTVRYKPTCSLTVQPSTSVYTGGVPTNIYLGYGPQSARIVTTAGGGGLGFTYSWSGTNTALLSCTNCFNPLFTPTAPGIYTYTVTVTNSSGCTTTCTVTFCVKDIRVPGTNNVYICHEGTTMSVTTAQAASHLSSHPTDKLGRCDQVCTPGARLAQNGGGQVIGQDVKVYPNPNHGSFIVDLPAFEGQAQIFVADVQGKIVTMKTISDRESNRVSMELGNVARGMYFVEVIYAGQRFRTKLIIE